jgi:DNA mismatch endonuclease (patch repair protein)
LRKVIFVHGCFWHQHQTCSDGRLPLSNVRYWRPKLTRNVQRDAEHLIKLKLDRWKTLVIWDCETRDKRLLEIRLRRFLR